VLLTQLDVRSSALPSPPPIVATFESKVGLGASVLDSDKVVPGHPLTFQLVWVGIAPTPEDFTVFVHLRNAANETIAQSDGQPIAGSFPTSQWQRGDVVYDRRSLDLPAKTPPGTYHLIAGLYRRETLKRLEAQTAGGRAEADEVKVGDVTVVAP
jgi:hypothetical protein